MFGEYICSVLDVVQSILVEANLFLAIRLQPDLIIRAFTISRLKFKRKKIF